MCSMLIDIEVAGRRDEDVRVLDDVLERADLVAFHRRLQGADRIDLGDDDPAALPAQRLRAALAHFAVAEHDRHLAAEHHVGGAVEPVGQRVPAAVDVVELALGDRVVDVDRREEQGVRPPSSDRGGGRRWSSPRSRRGCLCESSSTARRPRSPSGGCRGCTPHSSGSLVGVERRHGARLLELERLVHEQRGVAAVVDDQRRTRAVGPDQRLLRAPPVLLERLALPREDRDAARARPPCRRSRGGRRRPRPPRDPGSRRCCTTPSARRRRGSASVSMRTAVCTVMCRLPMTRAPASGFLPS